MTAESREPTPDAIPPHAREIILRFVDEIVPRDCTERLDMVASLEGEKMG